MPPLDSRMHETLLFSSCALSAPQPKVAALLLAVEPGAVGAENAWLFDREIGATLEGGPTVFHYRSPQGAGTIELEPGRSVRYTGGWWYRATYTVTETEASTRVTLQIENAAAQPGWLVRLANPGWRTVVSVGHTQFEQKMRDAAARLGCAVEFV